MRILPLIVVVVVCLLAFVDAKKKEGGGGGGKKNAAAAYQVDERGSSEAGESATAAPATRKSSGGKKSHAESKSSSSRHAAQQAEVDDEDAFIEDVDEDKIDELLKDAHKHLVIFFYDGRSSCSACGEALALMEQIDDDIEATGYMEVVKTDDRRVARVLGVATFPALVFLRRRQPILYDGDWTSSEALLRWVRSHEEIAAVDLSDDDFESRTESFAPRENRLDWFVMFYDSSSSSCASLAGLWESVAHKLRGLVHVGRLDTKLNDDVAERFHVDADSQCPVFLLLHRGKQYRFKEAGRDVDSLVAFALHRFREQRGHKVPDPPTPFEHLVEAVRERVTAAIEGQQSQLAVAAVLVLVFGALIVKALRQKRPANAAAPAPGEGKNKLQ